MLENIKYEYSETNKSRYATNVTNPTEQYDVRYVFKIWTRVLGIDRKSSQWCVSIPITKRGQNVHV